MDQKIESAHPMSPDEIHAREAELITGQIDSLNKHPLTDRLQVLSEEELAEAEANGTLIHVQWGASAKRAVEVVENRGFFSPMIVRGMIFGAAGLIAGAVAGYFNARH